MLGSLYQLITPHAPLAVFCMLFIVMMMILLRLAHLRVRPLFAQKTHRQRWFTVDRILRLSTMSSILLMVLRRRITKIVLCLVAGVKSLIDLRIGRMVRLLPALLLAVGFTNDAYAVSVNANTYGLAGYGNDPGGLGGTYGLLSMSPVVQERDGVGGWEAAVRFRVSLRIFGFLTYQFTETGATPDGKLCYRLDSVSETLMGNCWSIADSSIYIDIDEWLSGVYETENDAEGAAASEIDSLSFTTWHRTINQAQFAPMWEQFEAKYNINNYPCTGMRVFPYGTAPYLQNGCDLGVEPQLDWDNSGIVIGATHCFDCGSLCPQPTSEKPDGNWHWDDEECVWECRRPPYGCPGLYVWDQDKCSCVNPQTGEPDPKDKDGDGIPDDDGTGPTLPPPLPGGGGGTQPIEPTGPGPNDPDPTAPTTDPTKPPVGPGPPPPNPCDPANFDCPEGQEFSPKFCACVGKVTDPTVTDPTLPEDPPCVNCDPIVDPPVNPVLIDCGDGDNQTLGAGYEYGFYVFGEGRDNGDTKIFPVHTVLSYIPANNDMSKVGIHRQGEWLDPNLVDWDLVGEFSRIAGRGFAVQAQNPQVSPQASVQILNNRTVSFRDGDIKHGIWDDQGRVRSNTNVEWLSLYANYYTRALMQETQRSGDRPSQYPNKCGVILYPKKGSGKMDSLFFHAGDSDQPTENDDDSEGIGTGDSSITSNQAAGAVAQAINQGVNDLTNKIKAGGFGELSDSVTGFMGRFQDGYNAASDNGTASFWVIKFNMLGKVMEIDTRKGIPGAPQFTLLDENTYRWSRWVTGVFIYLWGFSRAISFVRTNWSSGYDVFGMGERGVATGVFGKNLADTYNENVEIQAAERQDRIKGWRQ